MDVCAICKLSNGDDLIQPRQLGIDTINRASLERKDTVSVKIGDYIHKNCRKDYIHKWYIASTASRNSNSSLRNTRSSSMSFDFRKNCFVCGCPVTEREKESKGTSFVESRFREIDKKIMAEVSNRNYDDWALTVYEELNLSMSCMQQMQYTTMYVIPTLILGNNFH